MELMDGDLGEALADAASGRLNPSCLRRNAKHAIAVVLASAGYPSEPRSGDVISGIADAERIAGISVLHAGTRRDGDRVVTSGGRVLVVSAAGDTLQAARDLAYRGAAAIRWDGMQMRRDIGARALGTDLAPLKGTT
jgi:phosphoribosylamine--glycine ligase